jgi:hypothetical protein
MLPNRDVFIPSTIQIVSFGLEWDIWLRLGSSSVFFFCLSFSIFYFILFFYVHARDGGKIFELVTSAS